VKAADGPISEVLLIDDYSNDGSAEFVEDLFPDVIVIRNNQNCGPSVARNSGLENAANRLVALLDNDVVVTKNWLQPMIAAIKADERIAICTSRALIYEDPRIIDRDGDEAHFVGMPTQRNSQTCLSDVSSSPPVEVGSTSGISILVDKEKIPAEEAFDPDYFYGFEDLDFCLATRITGHSCFFVPDSVVYHKYRSGGAKGLSHDEAGYPARRALYVFRNRWLILYKFYSLRTLTILAPALFVFELTSLLFAVRKRLTRQYWKAVRSFLTVLPAMRKKRKRIQASRVISDRELLSSEPLTPGAGTVRGSIEARLISFLSAAMRAYWKLARPLL
jgi:hypothetical protein